MSKMIDFIVKLFNLPIHLWEYFAGDSVTTTSKNLDLLVHKSIQMGMTIVSAHVIGRSLERLDTIESPEVFQYAQEVDGWIEEINAAVNEMNERIGK